MTDCVKDPLSFEPRLSDGYCYLDVKLLNDHGLHARPSTMFFEKIMKPYHKKLKLAFMIHNRNGQGYIPIGSVFDLMGLGLECGTVLTVRISYQDEALEDEKKRDKELGIAQDVFSLFATKFQVP